MLHTAEVYTALADATDDPAVRGWAEVSRLLADPSATLRFVPEDPDDSLLSAFLDPAGWWRLAHLGRHRAIAIRAPLPPSPPEVGDPLIRVRLGLDPLKLAEVGPPLEPVPPSM